MVIERSRCGGVSRDWRIVVGFALRDDGEVRVRVGGVSEFNWGVARERWC